MSGSSLFSLSCYCIMWVSKVNVGLRVSRRRCDSGVYKLTRVKVCMYLGGINNIMLIPEVLLIHDVFTLISIINC